MVQDLTLQIFLTIYHGQLIGIFFYDYIIRNAVRLFVDKLEWNIVLNIALGVFFIGAIIWAILSVWGKVRRNLIICTVVLLVVFIVRLVIGIMDIMEKKRVYDQVRDRRQYYIELTVFIAQIVVHAFGIVATYMLSTKAA